MTLHEVAEGFRQRAYVKGISAARSREEFDDDERIVAAYLTCDVCGVPHLSPKERVRALARARHMGDVRELAWGTCPRQSLD